MSFLLILTLLGVAPTPALADKFSSTTIVYSTTTAAFIVDAYATNAGVDAKDLYDTLQCESGMHPNYVGDKGTSFGVAQIHLPAHTEVTKEQALDPFFSIGWAAAQFKLGHQSWWSCWKQIHKVPYTIL